MIRNDLSIMLLLVGVFFIVLKLNNWSLFLKYPSIFLTVLATTGPLGFTILGGATKVIDVSGQTSIVYAGSLNRVTNFLVYFSYFLMIVNLTRNLLHSKKINFSPPIFLLLSIWFIAETVDFASGTIKKPQIALILVFLNAITSPAINVKELSKMAFSLTSLLIAFSGIAGIFIPDFSWLPCRLDKCNFSGFLFSGIFPYSNQFGIFIAFIGTLGFFAIESKKVKIIYLLSIFIILDLADSKTSILAVLFVMIAVQLKNIYLYMSLLMVTSFISFLPLFPVFSSNMFTGRPVFWRLAQQLFLQNPVGLGADGWINSYIPQIYGKTVNYSAHNTFLDVLVTAGLLGGLFYVLYIITSLKYLWQNRSKSFQSFFLLFLIISFSERPINFLFVDTSTPILMFLLLLYMAKSDESSKIT